MGENSNEVIKIVAGLAITLLLVLLGFGLFKFFSSKGESIKGQLGTTLDSATTMTYTQKDGEILSGSTVLNFITECEERNDEITIIVKTKKNTSGTAYVYDASRSRIADTNESTLKKNAKSKTHNDYISPNGQFECTVQKDATNKDLIVSITFEQQ